MQYQGHEADVRCALYLPATPLHGQHDSLSEAKIASISADRTLRVWDRKSGGGLNLIHSRESTLRRGLYLW